MSLTHVHKLTEKAAEFVRFESKQKHVWCSGCGDYGILNALTRALVLSDIKPQNMLMCYDVGCSGNGSDKLETYTIHGLHGRVTALSAGCQIGNHKLPIIASAGDGATFSEGINHLLHAIRNNYNVTFICHNNNNYGLTTGQASSTTPLGQHMNGTVGETTIPPLNPMQLALSLNPTFVARGFAGDVEGLSEIIQQGIAHQGFSFIEVFQACPTYNKATPQSWYFPRVYNIATDPTYDNTDIWAARKLADSSNDRIATGVLYYNPDRPDYYSSVAHRAGITTSLAEEVKHVDVTKLMEAFV